MKTTYWKRESISTGEIVVLFKIEETGKEANRIMQQMGLD